MHLASVHCPVLADKSYGGRDQLRLSDVTGKMPDENDEILIGRQALHACRLRFRHPRLERWMEFAAPLPLDMTRTIEALRRWRKK